MKRWSKKKKISLKDWKMNDFSFNVGFAKLKKKVGELIGN
jgi:hypothetical protein